MAADVVIVGGGLAGSLAAWRWSMVRPDLDIQLVDQAATLGGNHTWSLHDSDIAPSQWTWLAPLVRRRWPSHEVRFPARTRILTQGYASLDSTRLHEVVAPALGPRLHLGVPVAAVSRTRAVAGDGRVFTARVVIDARGGLDVALPLGWQTFLGQEIACAAPHGVERPLLMDATVAQAGAYKFMYVLPWDERRLLVEDTAYADTPEVAVAAARTAIAAYCDARGWTGRTVVREERGALPLPLGGGVEVFWPDEVPRIGLRAGLFHPTTGYSLPDAVATADLLAAVDPIDADGVYSRVRAFATDRWHDRAFFRLLNRLLFRAAAPAGRVRVLQQFYGRPADLIARFYAGRLTRLDRLRLLSGWPPVPIGRALAELGE
ncbi:MAG: lycopene beta-cyclase CrtY [Vicinamibacterales bacterium]